jgi:hypothetical protein
MNEVFTASRLQDALSPDEVVFSEKGVTLKINKVIGGTENFVFYKDISGVEIESGLMFSTIRVIPRARPEIVIDGFTKADAKKIKQLILDRV